YRAARRLARTPYRTGLEQAAAQLPAAHRDRNALAADGPLGASLAALTWSRPGPAARWLTGEALAEVSVRLTAAAIRPASVQRPGEARARAALARHAADHRIFEQAAEIRSQRLHAPFFDNQVVRACRALPESLRVQPGARSDILRAVLAGAGIHDLPPGWGATTHATEAAATRTGMRAAVTDLMALFDAPLLADAGLIEARVVRKALRKAAEGEPIPLDGIADLVSTELWLRRLLSRRGTCWTGSAAPRQRAVAGGVIPRPTLHP
ncbi:asparagine synthase-related protein, partial [Streptomyces niveus]